MRLFSWLKNWTGLDHSRGARRTGSGRKPTRQFRPQLEALEDRWLPSFTPGGWLAYGGYGVAVGDFNHDKNLDVASLSTMDMGVSALTVQLGSKFGVFYAEYSPRAGYGATILAVGAFDHDNRLDVIVEDRYGVQVLLGNGDGTFSHGSEAPIPGTPATYEGDQTVA